MRDKEGRMMGKKVPLRKCTGCNEMKEKFDLVRVVLTTDGFLVDETGKISGRGAYVCLDGACLTKMKKKKGLDRSFKQSVPQEIYDELTIVIQNKGGNRENEG